MEKFIPYEKLSKKERKRINSLKRTTWHGFNPITRKPTNPKAYKRNKKHDSDYFPSCFFMPVN